MRFLVLTRAALAVALALSAAASQAQTAANPPAPPVIAPAAPKLTGAPLYIYSFLDVREEEFSSELLAEVDKQLQAALTAQNVPSKLLRFRDSTVADSFAQLTAVPTRGRSQSTELIPVGQTIQSNLDAERSFGARYRLLAFPSNFEVSGGWRFFQIRWRLIDCATNRTLWNYTYKGRNMIWLVNGERAESRAKPIVDTLIAQLQSQGFL